MEFWVFLLSHGKIIVGSLGLDFGHVAHQTDPHSVLTFSRDNGALFFRNQKPGGRGEIYPYYSRSGRIGLEVNLLLHEEKRHMIAPGCARFQPQDCTTLENLLQTATVS